MNKSSALTEQRKGKKIVRSINHTTQKEGEREEQRTDAREQEYE